VAKRWLASGTVRIHVRRSALRDTRYPEHERSVPNLTRFSAFCFALGLSAQVAAAQATDADSKAVIAIADSVLKALSTADNATLSRLVLDSAVIGGAGLRDGVERVNVRGWRVSAGRGGSPTFTEREFDAKHPSGPPSR